MAIKRQEVDNLLNGVSQQAPQLRLESQAEAQINGISWPSRGLNKRPPTFHTKLIDATPGTYGNAFLHTINRDTNERFRVVIFNGDLKVFDENGVEQTVEFPNGKTYLTEALPNLNFRAASIGDFTFITNRTTEVAKKTTTAPVNKNEALIFVKTGDFDTTYRVKIDNQVFTVQSAQGDGPKDRYKVGTQLIANGLWRVLFQALRTTFTITDLGNSTIHIVRQNGADFTIKSEDGLAGEGLVIIKGKVQRFTDLPPFAVADFVVEVTGSQGTKKDNFFVKYIDDSKTADRAGVWIETLLQGEEISLDETTMPHVLIRKGQIVEEIAALNEPLVVVEEDTNEDTFTRTDGWSAAQNAADPENGDEDLSVDLVEKFSNLDDGDNIGTELRINYDVDTRVAGLATARLDFYLNDGASSTNWTLIGASPVFSKADGFLLDQFVVFTGRVWQDDWDLRAILVYTNTPCCLPDDVITFTLHGEDHYLPGVQYNIATDKRVHFADAIVDGVATPQTYPKGIEVTVIVDGLTATYTPSADETGAQVATAIAPTINALSNITAVDEGSGVVKVSAVASEPIITVSTDYTGATDFFITADLGVGATDLTGQLLTNLTDGSTGTILNNTTKTLQVVLAGGTDNKFQVGDLVIIEGTGASWFVFRPAVWKDRAVGTIETNPFPSFVGQEVREVFHYRNRFGMTAGENIILSTAGGFFDFFRESVQDFLDGDPIDLQGQDTSLSVFDASVHWEKELYLFTDQHQFVLKGEPLLTPTTARLPKVSSFRSNKRVRPYVTGNRMYFCTQAAGFTTVWEYFRVREEKNDAVDTTLPISRYLEGNPIQIAGSSNHGLIAVLTDADKSLLYVYQTFFNEEGTKLQSAWHQWDFGADAEILGFDFIESIMGLVIKRNDGVYFETMDIDSSFEDTGSNCVIHLDRKLRENSTGVSVAFSGGDTTWTIPFDVREGVDGNLQVVRLDTGALLTTTRPADNTIRVVGADLSAVNVFIGTKYTFEYELSQQYIRRQSKEGGLRAVTEGRTQILTLMVNHTETKDYKVEVTRTIGPVRTYTFASTATCGEDGSLRVPILSNNLDVTIKFINDQPGRSQFQGFTWEARHKVRGRR